MMEHIHEEQLALYATGDLAPGIEAAVAAHVQGCESCQATVAGFRATQSLLVSALIEPAADELVEVRERVSTRLRERRWWVGWTVAAAAAIALVTMFITFEHKPTVVPKPASIVTYVPVYRIAPKPPPMPAPVLHKPHVRHRDVGMRSVALVARADQPPVFRIATADPNVVILWQSNEGMKNE